MEDNIKKALSDVEEIKRVLGLTFGDFSAAAKLFFTAGIFWVIEGLLSLADTFGLWHALPDGMPAGRQAAIVIYARQGLGILGLAAVLAVYLHCRGQQKRRAQGLGLQLIDLWGCLFLGVTVYGELAARLSRAFSPDEIALYVNIPYLFLMAAMPLLLMATGILTGRGAPKLLALVYAVVSIVILVLPTTVEYAVGQGMTQSVSLGAALSTSVIPGIFAVILGGVMKLEHPAPIFH
ncbi:MAG: hypothetical protein K2N94_05525 [Lachnospiraceae bacterium]|nr:hypothetical protein [Lachnospiraceae bacterium]